MAKITHKIFHPWTVFNEDNQKITALKKSQKIRVVAFTALGALTLVLAPLVMPIIFFGVCSYFRNRQINLLHEAKTNDSEKEIKDLLAKREPSNLKREPSPQLDESSENADVRERSDLKGEPSSQRDESPESVDVSETDSHKDNKISLWEEKGFHEDVKALIFLIRAQNIIPFIFGNKMTPSYNTEFFEVKGTQIFLSNRFSGEELSMKKKTLEKLHSELEEGDFGEVYYLSTYIPGKSVVSFSLNLADLSIEMKLSKPA